MQQMEDKLNCEVVDLGLTDYYSAYTIQKQCWQDVVDGKGQKIILCEHPTVITFGRMADESNMLIADEDICDQNIEVAHIDRGGDITLHSPGQLIVYPILDLKFYGKDIKRYLVQLEQVTIDLLKTFDILADRSRGNTGVWVGQEKIASLGIGVKKWVAYHGVGLNVNTDLKKFEMIRPCGLNVRMTSMATLKGKTFDMAEVKTRLLDCFGSLFNFDLRKC